MEENNFFDSDEENQTEDDISSDSDEKNQTEDDISSDSDEENQKEEDISSDLDCDKSFDISIVYSKTLNNFIEHIRSINNSSLQKVDLILIITPYFLKFSVLCEQIMYRILNPSNFKSYNYYDNHNNQHILYLNLTRFLKLFNYGQYSYVFNKDDQDIVFNIYKKKNSNILYSSLLHENFNYSSLLYKNRTLSYKFMSFDYEKRKMICNLTSEDSEDHVSGWVKDTNNNYRRYCYLRLENKSYSGIDADVTAIEFIHYLQKRVFENIENSVGHVFSNGDLVNIIGTYINEYFV